MKSIFLQQKTFLMLRGKYGYNEKEYFFNMTFNMTLFVTMTCHVLLF